MENEIENKNYALPASIVIAAIILAGAWLAKDEKKNASEIKNIISEENIIPEEIVLPVRWGDIGVKMASVGAIDAEKFESLYASRGGLPEDIKKLLYDSNNGNLKITKENSGVILNLLWALGLGNKNQILEQGPMNDSRYGGAQNFASTGGWTLAKGETMAHYSRHPLIILTKEQQELIERTSKNIYRPCCGNSTYFPDCNHGMAMLGLLELMASQGLSEEEMYKYALIVNSYWFPDTYLAIADYFEKRGIKWSEVNPKEILGQNYSSASGYQRILKETEPRELKGGGGCGA
ncbi:MAG: hypothetical protein A2W71_01700 [Candidatus Nealsonbacteria bacterium RIFCSPLOWO2_02_39_8]|uniref:Uncharacterized protein n=2 Tax=Parcubacteria group TaxID=1794811 RepID=A0A1G2EM50_9BACT|nr:MAG: hypothetical protein A2W71_01700 [Candidatus Nealsonbacteria bacterium RIFCSPLOWO2_02_39_8]OGZ32524.1 MAG: hypothetical protein A3H02_00055 [Candidatus Niyogibacteria bacterium RIFCSPLOWO2_12_FULL_41_13]